RPINKLVIENRAVERILLDQCESLLCSAGRTQHNRPRLPQQILKHHSDQRLILDNEDSQSVDGTLSLLHVSYPSVDSRQAAMRDLGKIRHDQRRTSLVLVMRTQVQPVSLHTRASPAPGAP